MNTFKRWQQALQLPVFFVLVASLFFVGTKPTLAAVQTIVSGTVTYDTGAAAPNITVEFHNGDGTFSNNAITSATGAYSFSLESSTVPTTINLTLEVHTVPDGYTKPDSLQFTYNGTAQTKDFSITGVHKQIHVTVVDQAGVKVAAQVTATPKATGQAGQNVSQTQQDFSDGTGTLYVNGGDYEVTADANLSEQDATRYPWMAVGGSQAVSFANNTTTEEATVQFTVARANNLVSITMLDADGNTLTGSSFKGDVTVNGLNQDYGTVSTHRKVDSTSVAKMYLLPGIYHVSAFHPQLSGQSYNRKEVTFIVPDTSAGDSYTFGAFRAKKNVGVLKGIVTGTSGSSTKSIAAALSAVSVLATNLDTGDRFHATTGSDGSFTVNNVSEGRYSIFVDDTNYVGAGVVNADITSTDSTVTDLTLTADFADMQVSGSVMDNGVAVTGLLASVVLKGSTTHYSAPVQSDGSYILRLATTGITDKTMELNLVTQPGADEFATSGVTVTITPNSHVQQNITTSNQEATISGVLTDLKNTTLTSTQLGDNALVMAMNVATGSVEEAIVNADGSYTLKVGAGEWKLLPELNDPAATAFSTIVSDETITVQAGETLTGEKITLPTAAGTVAGVITDNAGAAVPNAPVTFTNLPSLQAAAAKNGGTVDQNQVITVTALADKTGNFSKALPEGDFTAIFSSTPNTDSLTQPLSQDFTITSGKTSDLTAEFRTAGASFQGTVSTVLDSLSAVAYSDKGGTERLDADDTTGKFSGDLAPGKWTVITSGIKAGKIWVGQNDVTIIDGGINNLSSKVSSTGVDLPAAVSVSGDASQNLSITNPEGAAVNLPAYASGLSGTTTLELVPDPQIVFSGGVAQVGLAYDVNVTNSSSGNVMPIHTLNSDATITLPVDKALEGGLKATDLMPTYYNSDINGYLTDGIVASAADTSMTLQTKHLSRFSVAATSSVNLTAPKQPTKLQAKLITMTSASLLWKQPKSTYKAKFYMVQVRIAKSKKTKQWLKYNHVTATTLPVTGLKSGKRYQFRVKACASKTNCSSFSSWKAFKTKK